MKISKPLQAVSTLMLGYFALPASGQIAVQNQGYIPFSDAPINYRSNDLHDPVAKLQQKLDGGSAKLVYEPGHGYLSSVLQLLQIPAASQTLVFSKTSFQYPKISPEHPRALYFNDDVYVGSVHDGKAIEIVSFDPVQGAIFYLLDEHEAQQPRFERAELDCTQCHIAAGTRGVPGVLLRSVYPTAIGTVLSGSRSFITDQESPLGERWGGWYVTGQLPDGARMANAIVPNTPETSHTAGGTSAPLQKLAAAFDPSSYLSPESDVVAHLVLAHQTQMHNLITLTNYKTRIALYSQSQHGQSQHGSGGDLSGVGDVRDVGDAASLPEATRRQFERPAEQLLRYLLFVNEAPLSTGARSSIGDGSSFAREFAARGPRDPQGRSLRDFDLRTRIFRYPCSYLIYSDAFDAIPQPAKGYIYHRLFEILTGRDPSRDFAQLTEADRRAILEILIGTKRQLPEEWSQYAGDHRLKAAQEPVMTRFR